ncbi:MAG TPA: GNAT family N-acetyltransferase [Pseudoduganella sp.]
MTEADVPAAHQLSLAVRWPHRLEDWQFVQRLGAGYVAEAEGPDGQPVITGTALCWSHGTEFASIGMVIVSPDWQGQGIGKKLMSLALGELGKRTVLLHATEAGKALYESYGFSAFGTVHQHQGTVFKTPLLQLPVGERIRPMGARDAAKIAALAGRAAGMPRATVLSALQNVAEGVVIDRYDEMVGFALLRRFGHGYAIGPVVAPDIERAKALIAHWTGTYGGAFLRIDVNAESGLSPWLTELGLVQVDSVLTMSRGEPPLNDPGMKVYGLISQALG